MAVYKGLNQQEIYAKRSSRMLRNFLSGKMTFSDLNREMKREGKLNIKVQGGKGDS